MDNYCVSETYCVGSINVLWTITVSVKPTRLRAFNEIKTFTTSVKLPKLGEPTHLGAPTELEAGYALVQFVETQRYNPGGRWLDSLWRHWDLSLT